MQNIDNYINEKLYISKGYKAGYEIDNKEDFLNYFKDHDCEIYIDDDNIKCWIWLKKGKKAPFTWISAKFPYAVMYLYDEWWDVRKQGDREPTEMHFWYSIGPRACQSMKRYEFKRTTHLIYNVENAEKILNKLNYVYDNHIK